MEIFMEMNDDSLEQVAYILNQRWDEEAVPEGALQARVAMIYIAAWKTTGKYPC